METAQKLRELSERLGPHVALTWDSRFGWWTVRLIGREGGPLGVGTTVDQAIDKAARRVGLDAEDHLWRFVKR